MIKCKGFVIPKGFIDTLPKINMWLKQNPNIKLLQIAQTIEGNNLYITICFEE